MGRFSIGIQLLSLAKTARYTDIAPNQAPIGLGIIGRPESASEGVAVRVDTPDSS
jgi:hypothetical protein